jgi:pentose-5-phosphate-3-epimerase
MTDEGAESPTQTQPTEIRILVDGEIDQQTIDEIDDALGEMLHSSAYIISQDGAVPYDDVRDLLQHRRAIADA